MKNKPLSKISISRFMSEEAYGGIILIIVTLVALIWSNSSSELAFKSGDLKQIVKVGIITASLISAVTGMIWLGTGNKKA